MIPHCLDMAVRLSALFTGRHSSPQKHYFICLLLLLICIYTCNSIPFCCYVYILRKAVPVTDRGSQYGCETSRLPHFLDNRLTHDGVSVSLRRGPRFNPHKDSRYSLLLEIMSPQDHIVAGRIRSTENIQFASSRNTSCQVWGQNCAFIRSHTHAFLFLVIASCCDCYYKFLGVPSFATVFCFKCF
jgi:hypothetical protein